MTKLADDEVKIEVILKKRLVDQFDAAWRRLSFSTRSEALRIILRMFLEENDRGEVMWSRSASKAKDWR